MRQYIALLYMITIHPSTILEIINDAINPTWAAELLYTHLIYEGGFGCRARWHVRLVQIKSPVGKKKNKKQNKRQKWIWTKTHLCAPFPALMGHQEQRCLSGKVGHLLIMERRHLTINHESKLRTAQQTKHLLFWASLQKLHSFTDSAQFKLVPFSAHWRQQWTSIFMQRGVYQRAGASSAVCDSIQSNPPAC